MLVAKFTTGNLMGVLMKHLHAAVLAIKRENLHIQYIQLYIQLLCNMIACLIHTNESLNGKNWQGSRSGLFFEKHFQCLGHHVQAEIYKVLPFTFQFCSNKCHYKVFRLVIKKLLMCFLHVNQFNTGIVMLTLLYITAFIISHSCNI